MLVLNSVTGARLYARVLSVEPDVVRADVPGIGMVGFDRDTGHGRYALAAWQLVPNGAEADCVPAAPPTSVGEEFARRRAQRRRTRRAPS